MGLPTGSTPDLAKHVKVGRRKWCKVRKASLTAKGTIAKAMEAEKSELEANPASIRAEHAKRTKEFDILMKKVGQRKPDFVKMKAARYIDKHRDCLAQQKDQIANDVARGLSTDPQPAGQSTGRYELRAMPLDADEMVNVKEAPKTDAKEDVIVISSDEEPLEDAFSAGSSSDEDSSYEEDLNNDTRIQIPARRRSLRLRISSNRARNADDSSNPSSLNAPSEDSPGVSGEDKPQIIPRPRSVMSRATLQQSASCEILQEITAIRSKLPKGYAFVRKGNIYITRKCREFTHNARKPLYVVVKPYTRTQIGIGVPTEFYIRACRFSGSTRKERRAIVKANDKKIRTAAEATISRLYPRMPKYDRAEAVIYGFQKRSGRAGRVGALNHEDRARHVVVAYVRHKKTSYDQILVELKRSGEAAEAARDKARQKVNVQLNKVLRRWRA